MAVDPGRIAVFMRAFRSSARPCATFESRAIAGIEAVDAYDYEQAAQYAALLRTASHNRARDDSQW